MNKRQWLELIENRGSYGLCVNRKYCPQLKEVSILRKLIKQGLVRRERTGTKYRKHTRLFLN